jgi:hypothetical protein
MTAYLEKTQYKAFIVLIDRHRLVHVCIKDIDKGIPARGRGGPQGCETSRFPYFLDNRPTDGGEVVILTPRPHLYPQEDSWYRG